MTLQNQLKYRLDLKIFLKRALTGAGLALLLLAVFLMMFGKVEYFFWIAASSISIGGAGAGAAYYLCCDLLEPQGTQRIIPKIFSAVLFLVSFWLSLVFALAQVGLWD
ncbi:hypothetical protein RM553_10230 [Zunongwangia sp. F363]|uniref:Uncharacterized protein n=1 Tax=Autumnicola tepida TaxID=3075595 RepID=A0ABU3CA44_9FLAO|nr:hypothetical protein [Zunongwangia sp. F363]MDT0643204.1 hypothetical protein [Zunongwangia sp. F363]